MRRQDDASISCSLSQKSDDSTASTMSSSEAAAAACKPAASAQQQQDEEDTFSEPDYDHLDLSFATMEDADETDDLKKPKKGGILPPRSTVHCWNLNCSNCGC